jgi:hypothetical protein
MIRSTTQVKLTASAVVARQANRLTLIPLTGSQVVDIQLEPLPDAGGYALVAILAQDRKTLATFSAERQARRQLNRLCGRPFNLAGWAAKLAATTALLFAVWFLFFLPAEGEGPLPGWLEEDAPAASQPRAAAPSPSDFPAPALLDDPAAGPPAAAPHEGLTSSSHGSTFDEAFGLKH